MEVLKMLLLLYLFDAALAVEDLCPFCGRGRRSVQQPSLPQTTQDANELIDQLLKSAQDKPELDIAQLQDQQIRHRLPSQTQVKILLQQGQLSGIARHASRQGETRLDKKEQQLILASEIEFSQLQVQYSQIDIETQPDQEIHADSLRGTLRNIRGLLVLQLDQQSGEFSLRSLQLEPQQPQQADLTLEGAEEFQQQNPQLRNQIAKQVQEAAALALHQQMQQIVQRGKRSN